MSTLADQIRELQKRLEQISEAPVAAFNQNAQQDAAPAADAAAAPAQAEPAAPAQSAMNVASNNVPQPAAEPAADPNQIPTIEAATFSQAYAQAVKQGLKKFKWCGVYAVKNKPKPPQPQPVKQEPRGIQPAVYVRPIQPQDFGGNQNQADTLNLVAAGNMGA